MAVATALLGGWASGGYAGSPGERPERQRITLSWRGQQLGTALDRLSSDQQAPLWVDRRVDTSAPVDFDADDQPLVDALRLLAEQHAATAIDFRGVVYFGPANTAHELPALAARARASLDGAPAERRRRWLTAAPWSIARLSEPRELLREIAEAAGATVEHAERVPHDLWPARTLPSLSPLDRAVLVLAGFDLTGEIAADGGTLRVVPIRRPIVVQREYAVPEERRGSVDAVLADATAAESQWRGRRLTLNGPLEVHERLRAALTDKKVRTAPAPRAATSQQFTLKIENRPVGPVLQQLASQLNLKIVWSSDVQPADREALTSCNIRQADLDALLEAILTPAHLTFERSGQEIRISPAK